MLISVLCSTDLTIFVYLFVSFMLSRLLLLSLQDILLLLGQGPYDCLLLLFYPQNVLAVLM